MTWGKLLNLSGPQFSHLKEQSHNHNPLWQTFALSCRVTSSRFFPLRASQPRLPSGFSVHRVWVGLGRQNWLQPTSSRGEACDQPWPIRASSPNQSEQILGLQLEPSRKQHPLTVDLNLERCEPRVALATVADGLPDKTDEKRQILQELDPDLPREFSMTWARISLVFPHRLV